ncbi:MAG: hypothetical protein F4Y44_03770 [Chloroflexi bacterium]|nr:hypothetical protein [Chloroflexota bacterium]
MNWAVDIRTKAEREIARDAVSVPAGVLQWLDDLSGRGEISERERDAVNLWNGVGSSNRSYTLQVIMKNVALLPEAKADVPRWWMRQVRARRAAEFQCVAGNSLRL